MIVVVGMSILVILVLGLAAGNYFYRMALKPGADRSAVIKAPHNELPKAAKLSERSLRWFEQMQPDDVFIKSFDDLKLHAYQIIHEPFSHYWLIGCHGYSSTAKQLGARAKRFYDMDMNILLPDARGHGLSEGGYIGMGWHERCDVRSWTDYILKLDSDAKIVLYGVSMGAATVMMAAGEPLPDGVSLVIEDCGYSSIKAEFVYQLKSIFKLPSFPLLYFADFIGRIRAGYSIVHDGNVVRQVEKAAVPMLFIHGDSDTFVPFYMLDEVYRAANVKKEKYVVADAGHGGAADKAGEAYWDKVGQFIAVHIDGWVETDEIVTEENAMKRFCVFFSGRVQGVGFRFFCQCKAGDYGLTGWVKNLPDGRVQAEIQGDLRKIELFLAKAYEGDYFIRVGSIDKYELPLIDDEQKFEARY